MPRSARIELGLVVPPMEDDTGRPLPLEDVVYRHLRPAFGPDVVVHAWNPPNPFTLAHTRSRGWMFEEEPAGTWSFRGWHLVSIEVEVSEQPGQTDLQLPVNVVPTAAG